MPHALLLAPWFPPSPGGAERYAWRLFSHAPRSGWDVTVATDGRIVAGRHDGSPAPTPGVHRLTRYAEQLADPRRVAWRSMQFAVLDELDDVLVDRSIDLVHANSIETAVLGRVIADHLGVPLVVTIHEHAPQAESFGRGRLRLAFRRLDPDAVVAPSSFYHERARAEGVPPDRIHLIPHGVEVPPAPPSPAPGGSGRYWGLPEGAWVALTVGRIYHAKGTWELVRATALAREAVPQLRVVVVGPDGPSEYADRVRAEVRRSGLADVLIFAGPKQPEEMPTVLAHADAVVAPSLAEGFGLAVAEAMALGRAVLASAVGGLTDLVDDGVDGVLVPPGDVRALAAALVGLASDPEHSARLGAAARRTISTRHEVGMMVTRTTALYDHLLARDGTPPRRR